MWGKQTVTWGGVRRLVIKYIKNHAPDLWDSEPVRVFMLLGHCEHPDGCLESMHDLLSSAAFRSAVSFVPTDDRSRVPLASALPLLLGIALGFFGASVLRASRVADVSQDWVDDKFNFGVITRNLRSTVYEKRLRALTNACVSVVALAVMIWFVAHMFPFVVTYMRDRRRVRSSLIWRMLRHTPVVNESFIVVELVLVSVVLVMFTAMLHFTGMLKWMRTLLARLWYDCCFAMHGDPVDNHTQRNILVEMDILRRDTKASLGGARNIDEAVLHRDWTRVHETTTGRRDELHRAATAETQRIAMSMRQIVGGDAVRRVRDAFHDEHTFVSGVRTRVTRLLRGPAV